MERLTVSQFLERLLTDSVSHRNKPPTIDGCTQIVRQHLILYLDRHQLDQLTPEHVQAMLNTLRVDIDSDRATLRTMKTYYKKIESII